MCLVRLDEHELNPKALAQVRKRRRSVNQRFEDYLAMGIKDGSILPCDVRLTAFWIAVALNWISRWYKPGREMSSEDIGEYFADNLTRGLTAGRSEEHTSETQSLMRISYAVFCLKNKNNIEHVYTTNTNL